jgi:hypothetical protein
MVLLEYLQPKPFELIHLTGPLILRVIDILLNMPYLLLKYLEEANDLFLQPFDLGHVAFLLGVHIKLLIQIDGHIPPILILRRYLLYTFFLPPYHNVYFKSHQLLDENEVREV